MPPHRLFRLFSYSSPHFLRRGAQALLVISVIALAGCATNSPSQVADQSSSIRDSREYFLSHTRSDPLGAYLSSRDLEYSSSPPPKSTRALASAALSVLGIKYRYGGEAPNTGFDCSGLVIYAAEKSLGLKLPRQSSQIAQEGTSIKISELKKGDLVFFNTRGHRNSHVGIYLGNRKFVHAPRKGAVVRIEDMDMNYWKKRYNGARRLAIVDGNDALASAN